MTNRIFTIPISEMAVKPSAIFLAKHHTSVRWWSVSLGFAAHTHHFNIIGAKNNLFFEHCEPCVYYRDKTCPGGEKVLLNSRPNNSYVRNPYGNETSVYNGVFCRKLFDDPEKQKNLKEGVKGVSVTLPDYFLTSARDYQEYSNNGKLKFSFLRQDLLEENNEDSYWNASPAPFPNTYESSGDICVGSNSIGDLGDFGRLQDVFLNQIYNYDLFYTSNYGLNDLESCLRVMNFDKFLEVTLKKRRGGDKHVLVPESAARNGIVRKILPPIYEKIWIDAREDTIYLTHSNGNNYTLPLDLSGEPVPVPVPVES
jgi:hypothetical protein